MGRPIGSEFDGGRCDCCDDDGLETGWDDDGRDTGCEELGRLPGGEGYLPGILGTPSPPLGTTLERLGFGDVLAAARRLGLRSGSSILERKMEMFVGGFHSFLLYKGTFHQVERHGKSSVRVLLTPPYSSVVQAHR